MPSEQSALDEASTIDLVRDAISEVKELAFLEVELARQEVREELRDVQRAAVGFAIAFAAGVVVLCLLATALVLALGGTAVVALLVAAGFLLVAGAGAWLGYRALPKEPFVRTRARLQSDLNQLKEHIA